MTAPGDLPSNALGGFGGIAAWGRSDAEVWKASLASGIGTSGLKIKLFGIDVADIPNVIAGAIGGVTDFFNGLISTLTGRVEDAESIINDHSQTMTDLVQAYEQMVLQGQATVYTSDNVHHISEGVTSLEIIAIGAGGGGAGGKWDLVGGWIYPGSGGGGGGEVHTQIVRPLIDGSTVPILVGRGGSRGGNSGNAGGGGGNSSFGPITAGGGQGGRGGESARTHEAAGGVGMIAGGTGGRGGYPNAGQLGGAGGNSVSQYSLNGGGGGGGGGGGNAGTAYRAAGRGGQGGISPGGGPNSPGGEPAGIVATGGGGGGGGGEASLAGDGAFPAGGGGGGYADNLKANSGGEGGHGIVFVIERTT